MDRISVYNILMGLTILKDVKEETIKDMTIRSFMRIYEEEEVLFLESNKIDNIFILSSGKALVSKFSQSGEEKIIHILSPGNFINEMSLDGRNTSTTVTITAGSKVVSFRKEDILRWMAEDFHFNLAIISSLSSKLRSSYRHIRNLGLMKINSRIVSRLCKLARDHGCRNENCITIDLDLTQGKLASMVGSTRESVSRFLKQLEREGIIKQSNHRISIIDMEKLKEYM